MVHKLDKMAVATILIAVLGPDGRALVERLIAAGSPSIISRPGADPMEIIVAGSDRDHLVRPIRLGGRSLLTYRQRAERFGVEGHNFRDDAARERHISALERVYGVHKSDDRLPSVVTSWADDELCARIDGWRRGSGEPDAGIIDAIGAAHASWCAEGAFEPIAV
jgi:hypothetical protein